MRFGSAPLALLGALAACGSSASVLTSTTTGTGGGGTTGGIEAVAGMVCNPQALSDLCASAGLVCDQIGAVCRLPENGEKCVERCAAAPAGLACHAVTFGGQAQSVCLVSCVGSDSAGCPYGTSCGDPNLVGYCSAQGSASCTAWQSCSLGATAQLADVSGTCVPSGVGNVCFASGAVTAVDGLCDPGALNAASASLCAAPAICETIPGFLGGQPDAGYCFALCFGDDGGCGAKEHCRQPNPAGYGSCRPGPACSLDPDLGPNCGAETVCQPDDASSLSGGCLALTPNAGRLGAPCQPPQGLLVSAPCASGVCLAADPPDAGADAYSCAVFCDLASGGRPWCVGQTCTPLSAATATDVVGACRQ